MKDSNRQQVRATRQSWQWQMVRFAPYIASVAILVVWPLFMDSYLQSLMAKILIFAIFGMSLDIIYGYTGLWSFGHAAFFGVAAYITGKLMVGYGISSLWIGAPSGILMAGLTAAILGFIALRVSGIYFLLITFALSQLLFSIAWKWRWLSSGYVEGIPGISRPDVGIPWFTWSAVSFYYFILLAFAISFLLLHKLTKSPFGSALKGIRDSETRMRSLGYNTWAHKYIAFIIAGVFAGLAGVLFAYQNGIVVPEHVGIFTSALAVLIVVVGGAGTLFGAPLGAGLVLLLQHFTSLVIPERWPLVLGAAYVASAMYARGGIGLHLVRFWNKLRRYYGSVKS